MKNAGIWLDHTRAYLIENSNGEETLAIIPALIERKCHPDLESTHAENRRSEETKRFFKYLAKQLRGASQVKVFGPGLLKTQFVKFLKDAPYNKTTAIEIGRTTSRLTLNQIRRKLEKSISPASMAY